MKPINQMTTLFVISLCFLITSIILMATNKTIKETTYITPSLNCTNDCIINPKHTQKYQDKMYNGEILFIHTLCADHVFLYEFYRRIFT